MAEAGDEALGPVQAEAQLEAKAEVDVDVEAPVVRFSASKVALVVGLHEFGDPAEELLACVYQDRDELLARDAARLQLRLVSPDAELEALMHKSGAAVATELHAARRWARDHAAPTRVATAQQLLQRVDRRLAEAQASHTLAQGEACEVRRLLAEEIHQSVGIRNENLALQAYERQTGSQVRLANDSFFFLSFPSPAAATSAATEDATVDYALLETQSRRYVVPKKRTRRARVAAAAAAAELPALTLAEQPPVEGFFSICGMVDGVADALCIAGDNEDDWVLAPVVVEVKNRLRAFRQPPPLYDQVQLAVYMKLLGLAQGDLVQCIYDDSTRPAIHVSRVALDAAPLILPPTTAQTLGASDLWTAIILPRLYAFTAAVRKLREQELLRLAFLNGSEHERRVMLRAECDFF